MLKWLFSLALVVSVGSHAATCKADRVTLQVLGSGGPELDDNRVSSSYLVWLDGRARVMVDAGPGSSVMFGKSGADFADLQGILLTHLHVDHVGDMPAYIKGSYFTDRDTDLSVFGPDKGWRMPSTSRYLETLIGEQGAYGYLRDYLSSDNSGDYKLRAFDVDLKQGKAQAFSVSDDISISAIPVHHGPIPAVAWKVTVAGCEIGFSGDMSNKYQAFAGFTKDADMLVMHNAIPGQAGSIAKNLHMTPQQIGQIAKQAEAKMLVLSHFMKRTSDQKASLSQIRRHYQKKVVFAEDGEKYPLTLSLANDG